MRVDKPVPLADAVAKISAKTPIGSVLRAREWAAVPLALRERAQFSAGVESARVLQAIQDRMEGLLKLKREKLASGATATFDRSSFIDAIRAIAREEGLTPEDPAKRGTVQDITSVPRLGMIFDMQQAQAQEYARWNMDQTEGALLLYPAQEFARIEPRRVPRQNWPERWAAAGGRFFEGRMVALKTDPVWEKLSRFGTPWPPFDFNSGMGIEDVDRDEAVRLGVMAADQDVEPIVKDFNERLEASAAGLSEELRQVLKTLFGKQIAVEGDRVVWQSNQGQTYERQREEQKRIARSVYTEGRGAFGGIEQAQWAAAETSEVLSEFESQWLSEIGGVVSGRKPLFHEALGGQAPEFAARLRKILPANVQVRGDEEGHLYVWRPDVLGADAAQVKSLLDKGTAFGYGINRWDTTQARVNIRIFNQATKTEVTGFWAPEKGHALFAKARTQDFVDATGIPHFWKVVARKAVGEL